MEDKTARLNITVEYENMNGDKRSASLVPLKRKEAAEVFHNTFVRMMKSGGNVENIIQDLDFDSLWLLASKILRGAVINRHIEIRSLDDCDYFDENPDELMLLTLQGIIENWPNFFRGKAGISAGIEK